MISNLDPKTSIEYNINFNGITVDKVIRTYCNLCGDVVNIKIEHSSNKIEEQDLSEFHTGCCE